MPEKDESLRLDIIMSVLPCTRRMLVCCDQDTYYYAAETWYATMVML